LPKWRKTLSPSIFISPDNPELPHTGYSFIYYVKFSHCRHSNLNWLLVAIHQEKTCNLETLLPEMLTGIGPYVCWRFLIGPYVCWRFLCNSSRHYVVVASVEGCTYCHGPVCVWKIFLWKVFGSMLSVCGSICGKYSIKFLVECICNQLQVHPTTKAQNFVQNSLSPCFSHQSYQVIKLHIFLGCIFSGILPKLCFFVNPVCWDETNYNNGMLHHVRYVSQRDWLCKDK
jgi:hypothetical protein